MRDHHKNPFQVVSSAVPKVDVTEDGFMKWETFLYDDPGLKKDLENEAMGYGIERCLYELNPELACLSPCLIHAAALTPAQALIALEEVASQPNHPVVPVDRHVAAFLISRWKELSLVDMRNLSKPQREMKNIAMLKILGGIQVQFKVHALPNLCQWMADLCAPVISHYHNRKARDRAQGEMRKAVGSGQLLKLLKVVENRQAVIEDQSDYQVAKIAFLLIESEIKEIEKRILNRNRLIIPKQSFLSRVTSLPLRLKQAYLTRKETKRIKTLYLRSEDLLDSWGEGVLPRGGSSAPDFWGKLWKKMNVSKASRDTEMRELRFE